MWERFTYYGMRALLILFMAGAVAKGRAGASTMPPRVRSTGCTSAGTYLLGLAGGWMADRLLGAAARGDLAAGSSSWVGNVAAGRPAAPWCSSSACWVIAMGVGLLKPNVSALVGLALPGRRPAPRRRVSPIFYMGINLGAFLGSLAVPWVAKWLGWRAGFALPALGMAIGVAQFLWTRQNLNNAGLTPAPERRGSWLPVIAGARAGRGGGGAREHGNDPHQRGDARRTLPPGRTRCSAPPTSCT